MKIGIPVYEEVNLLDVTGPIEMFTWVPKRHGLEYYIVSEDGAPVTSINGVQFFADRSFSQLPELDILWIPGGNPSKLSEIMSDKDSAYLAYIKQTAEKANWVCSVCEGALLAAQAGILDGHKVTTHWAFVKCLQRFSEIEVAEGNPRYVVSGNRLTGGGISSALDESLKLIELLFGKDTAVGVQRTTQYFPEPPVMGTLPPAPACSVNW
ncbi:DJ-1/PfpI family protein [Sphingorhabdus sp. Alg239-R122]|uniref:DJ-1/PfpI family protein n=1 Tax=Sphingorhabdus sp. Alg239-R122 TaxID=2305989 RepID=UPI0013DB38BE|nr:DJ-1/PfpI family protein [Sphingorhabdus sp. Alg239-R122]